MRDGIIAIRALLDKNKASYNASAFFKTAKGNYAEHDVFIGVKVPILRQISKDFADLPITHLQSLISSPINEERLLALFIMTSQYKNIPDEIYACYMRNLSYVNNWNLVDSSAHLILGAYLYNRDKNKLIVLAKSNNLWERRIAIVATWYFIRQNELGWTYRLAEILLNDDHDLIHKATGWMLREVGKKNPDLLIQFLESHHISMPRTMLRYAIERLPKDVREYYMRRD